MLRKSVRRRPELETLESIALLSGISTVAHPEVAALVQHLPQASKNIHLSGTVKGNYSVSPLTATIKFSASGPVSPLGSVSATGSLQVLPTPSGSMVVKTKKGNIDVKLSATTIKGPYIVKIYGGTKAYLGAHGTGSGSITRTGTLQGTFSLKFTATLVCLHC